MPFQNKDNFQTEKDNNDSSYYKNLYIQTKNNLNKEKIKNSKYEFLANRTVDLNERLDEVISQSTNKFNIVKDSVSKTHVL